MYGLKRLSTFAAGLALLGSQFAHAHGDGQEKVAMLEMVRKATNAAHGATIR